MRSSARSSSSSNDCTPIERRLKPISRSPRRYSDVIAARVRLERDLGVRRDRERRAQAVEDRRASRRPGSGSACRRRRTPSRRGRPPTASRQSDASLSSVCAVRRDQVLVAGVRVEVAVAALRGAERDVEVEADARRDGHARTDRIRRRRAARATPTAATTAPRRLPSDAEPELQRERVPSPQRAAPRRSRRGTRRRTRSVGAYDAQVVVDERRERDAEHERGANDAQPSSIEPRAPSRCARPAHAVRRVVVDVRQRVREMQRRGRSARPAAAATRAPAATRRASPTPRAAASGSRP